MRGVGDGKGLVETIRGRVGVGLGVACPLWASAVSTEKEKITIKTKILLNFIEQSFLEEILRETAGEYQLNIENCAS